MGKEGEKELKVSAMRSAFICVPTIFTLITLFSASRKTPTHTRRLFSLMQRTHTLSHNCNAFCPGLIGFSGLVLSGRGFSWMSFPQVESV
jgi:hypothetical protein